MDGGSLGEKIAAMKEKAKGKLADLKAAREMKQNDRRVENAGKIIDRVKKPLDAFKTALEKRGIDTKGLAEKFKIDPKGLLETLKETGRDLGNKAKGLIPAAKANETNGAVAAAPAAAGVVTAPEGATPVTVNDIKVEVPAAPPVVPTAQASDGAEEGKEIAQGAEATVAAAAEKPFYKKIIEMLDDLMFDPSDMRWIPTKATLLMYAALLLMLVGMVFTVVMFALINVSHKKVTKIRPENRYNKDLPEYSIARSSVLSYNKVPLLLIPLFAFGALLCLGVMMYLVLKTKTEQNIAGIPKIVKTTAFTVLPFALVVFIATIVSFFVTRKKLKNIKKRIDAFEAYVYARFYVNYDFLTVLYNGGSVPSDINSIVKKAAKTAFIDQNNNTRREILDQNGNVDPETVKKIVYTLNIYRFVNRDLTDEETLGTGKYYRSEAMSLFNPVLLSLPGRSRIFKVSEYMRSNIVSNMGDQNDMTNIMNTVNNILKMDPKVTNKINSDVKSDIYRTRTMAYSLGTPNAWKAIQSFMIVCLVTYAGIPVAMVLFTLIKRLVKAIYSIPGPV